MKTQMKTNTTRDESIRRSKATVLPKLKQQSNKKLVNSNQSGLLKSLSHEDLLLPDSNDIITKWLSVKPEPNKHVKFANSIEDKDEKTSQLTANETNSLSDINQYVHALNLTPVNTPRSENNSKHELLDNGGTHSPTTGKVKLHRTDINRTLSVSTVTSSSLATRLYGSPVLPVVPSIYHRASSIDNSASITSSSTVKYRLLHLWLLDLNASLSECDKKKFDDIREQVPDEFEQLLPALLKLGVLAWPKKIFDQSEQLTAQEMSLREDLISIIEKDKQNLRRQHHLQHLYGSVAPFDNVLHKNSSLRECLSFQGQLSLLEAYRDEIEKLLTKKIQYWISIPSKSSQASFLDETSSLYRSSTISSTWRAKTKFLQTISSRKTRLNKNADPSMPDESLSLIVPDTIDYQWKSKLLAKVIEQGMDILDQVVQLPQSSLSNQYDDTDLKGQEIARKYKRWLYLWSTLYTEEQ
ncbi:unnamed protein product [Rotaria socialis]|uniref:Uncharacterized protein n=2 Tax=Rotaria socialis TaxID=392032 RepID=A0A818AT50_9BILA|nr:unnamed protein product [Rotaria socialis]